MVTKSKALIRGMMLGVLLFAGLYGNIIAHEMGHWLVASDLNLNPTVHLFEPAETGTTSFFNQNFFTTYTASTPLNEKFVAMAGPIANLAIAVGLAILYTKIPKQKKYTRLVVLMLLIPAVLSFITNMIPTAGSDGAMLLQSLR